MKKNLFSKKKIHYFYIILILIVLAYNLYIGFNNYISLSSLILLSVIIMLNNEKILKFGCSAILIYVIVLNIITKTDHYPFVPCICIMGLIIANYLGK